MAAGLAGTCKGDPAPEARTWSRPLLPNWAAGTGFRAG